MVFNSTKKYLLVFSAILLIDGNIGFSSDSDEYSNDEYSNHDHGGSYYNDDENHCEKQKQYQLIGKISEYILQNNISNMQALMQKLNGANNNKQIKVESFGIKQQDKLRNDTIKKALKQAQAKFEEE